MYKEEKDLWNRIQEFSIDDPTASVKYSDKLASNNHWTGDYTTRVIEEYKKFMFLCCVLPRGASPSKAVDEAWHLHLTYTHNYWKEFCGNVLMKEIHHHPSKGGKNENHKHEEWYAETLDAYRKFFSYNPPEDIWPPGTITKTVAEQRIDPLSHIGSYKWFFPLLFVPLFITAVIYGHITPFNLTGPQFLVFYAVLAATTLLVIYLAFKKKIKFIEKLAADDINETANIYQLSRFVYGREQSVKAAVVDLTGRNILEAGWRSTFTFYPSRYEFSNTESNPILPALLKEKQEGDMITFLDLKRYYDEDMTYNPRLSEVYDSIPSWDFIGIILTVFNTVIGILRIIQGAANDKPFTYLLILMIIYVAVSIALISRTSERTILKSIFRDRFESGLYKSQLSSTPFANSFVFAGLASVSMIIGYSYLQDTFSRQRNNGDWNSSSGCGSSGCGSNGGGDGGSGCGGSGCGGCGGGGD